MSTLLFLRSDVIKNIVMAVYNVKTVFVTIVQTIIWSSKNACESYLNILYLNVDFKIEYIFMLHEAATLGIR